MYRITLFFSFQKNKMTWKIHHRSIFEMKKNFFVFCFGCWSVLFITQFWILVIFFHFLNNQSLQKFIEVGPEVKISKRLVLCFQRKIYNNKNFEKQNFSKKHHTLTNSKNSQFFTQKFKQKTLKFFIIPVFRNSFEPFFKQFSPKIKILEEKFEEGKNEKWLNFIFITMNWCKIL